MAWCRPRCLQCGKKPVKHLSLGMGGTDETYFCTLRCAAMFGLDQAVWTRDWCQKHNKWFHSDDQCPDCSQED